MKCNMNSHTGVDNSAKISENTTTKTTASVSTSSLITENIILPTTSGCNEEKLENSKSPISTSTYRETSATPSSNYQDSETTYYELCPHELRIDHENDDQIVIQNLCNRKHEKMNKPCQNGFCYCFTSDSDEVRFSQNKVNTKFRHKPRKNQQQQQVQHHLSNNKPVNTANINAANASKFGGSNNYNTSKISSQHNKISILTARARNISPPMPLSTTTSQDGSKSSVTGRDHDSTNNYKNTIIKSQRILRPRLHSSSIVRSRLRETFDPDPNAPLVRIVQEIHKNVVISEVRINRDKIKSCNKHAIKQDTEMNDETDQHIDENHEILFQERVGRILKFANKCTQTDGYYGRDSDSRASSHSGGRLLLKRIGSDAALKLKKSQDPPRKPPRRRFSNSSQSTKMTESSIIVCEEKATSPISMKSIGSPDTDDKDDKHMKHIDNNEKFKKNPYRTLLESLPSEKEIIMEESQNYQKNSPSCPTLSELSSANVTSIPQNSDGGETKEDSNKIIDSCCNNSPNIGWVRPDIVNMLHYEIRGNEKDIHLMKNQPEPQYQQQKLQQQKQQEQQKKSQHQMGWTVPAKKDIDTVDNVKLNFQLSAANNAATTAVEEEFNNFASSMESKSTPVKSQILSQSAISNKSFLKDKLLNRVSSNSLLKLNKRSLGNNSGVAVDGNDGNELEVNDLEQNKIIPFKQKMEKTIKTTTFRKKATQNTKTFFENSKKKFVRFMFGGNKNEHIDVQKFGKTVATQTFENELINSEPTISATASNIKQSELSIQKSIYPSIGTYPMGMLNSLSQKQMQILPSSLISASKTTQLPPSLSSGIDNFDFTRKINSPKIDRSFQRKLKFSPRKAFKNFTGLSLDDKQQQQQQQQQKLQEKFESYKSYDSDFINSDFRIAAMNDVLASIRSKLESNNGNTHHTEDEINDIQHHQCHNTTTTTTTTTVTGVENATNTASAIHDDSCDGCNVNVTRISAQADVHVEPIYSEIEDQNLVKNNSQPSKQNQDTRTEENNLSYVVVNGNNSNAIYAQVHKVSKNNNIEDNIITATSGREQQQQQNHIANHQIQTLDNDNDDNSSKMTQKQQQQEQQQELNHHQCHQCFQRINHEIGKIESDINTLPNSSNRNSYQNIDDFDDVSYNEPDESIIEFHNNHEHDFDQNSCTEFTSFHDNNKQQQHQQQQHQKSGGIDEQLKYCCKTKFYQQHNSSEKSFRCRSCPLPHSSKYGKMMIINDINHRNVESENNFPTNHNDHNDDDDHNNKSLLNKKYQNFTERLRLSFRKSRNFLKNEKKRLSYVIDKSLNRNDNHKYNDKLWDQSDLCISQLYESEILNEPENQPSITYQIEKAVSICRQMPQFESSTELVEAERLLLFSSLKRDLLEIRKYKPPPSILFVPINSNKSHIKIDCFEIPIKPDGNNDIFFNYFYIGVFVNGNIIKSTQSVEKRNDNVVVFTDCNIIFDNLEPNFGIRVYVYVLRLRKLCNFNYSQAKRPPRKRSSICSSDSGDEMISRFRLQGSFVIIAPNFAPYQIDEKRTLSSSSDKGKFYLNSFNTTCTVPLTKLSKCTNLCKEVKLTANVELIFEKFELKGFLNVEDKDKRHHWNQKWCQLDATLKLCFWDYPQDCTEKEPSLKINLIKCISYPIEIANREICARPKAFTIQIQKTKKSSETNDNNNLNDDDDDDKLIETYFLSTDNQKDLDYWINGLNEIIEFVRIWMY